MKVFFSMMLLSLLFLTGCKTGSHSSSNQDPALVKGMVSHKYRDGGCATVIIIQQADVNDPIIIIPKDPLPKKLDKDGTKVQFNYQPLRMPNPEGCEAGFVAEIRDLRAD